jgi:hypothetical protein
MISLGTTVGIFAAQFLINDPRCFVNTCPRFFDRRDATDSYCFELIMIPVFLWNGYRYQTKRLILRSSLLQSLAKKSQYS